MNVRSPLFLSLGLFLLGAPFRGGQWPSWLMLAACVLLVLDAYNAPGYRVPPWLRRPWLGVAAGAIFLIEAISFAEWSFGQVLWLAGAGVFLFDAWKRGEPRLLGTALRRGVESARAVAPATGTGSDKRVYWTLGLFAAAFLLGGVGEPPSAPRLGLLWLGTTVLVVLQTVWPGVAARLPEWLRRPTLGAIASAVYVVTSLALASWTPLSLLWIAATWVFVRDAAERGELGPFEPRLLWRGAARRCVLVGALLAAGALTATWDNAYHTPGYTQTHTSSHWKYDSGRNADVLVETRTTERISAKTFGGHMDAYDVGGGLPSWVLLAGLLALAWKGAPRVWLRFVPVGVGAALVAWALKHLVANRMSAGELNGSGAYTLEGEGPWMFLLGMIPFMVGAVMLLRAPAPTPAPAPMPASEQ